MYEFFVHFFVFISHNRVMDWYIYGLIIIMVIAFLSCLPIFCQVRFYVNALHNLGAVSFSIFGIRLVCFQLELHPDSINIIRWRKKDKEIPLSSIDKGAIFLQFFLQKVLNWTSIRQFSIFFGVGKENDAFLPNMAGGIFLTIMSALVAYLFNLRGEFPCYLGVDSDCEHSEIKISGYISFALVPLSLIFSVLSALCKTKKVVNVYERILRKNKNRTTN